MKKLYAMLFASLLGCSSAHAASQPPLQALLSGLNLSGLLGSNPAPAGLPLLAGLNTTLGNLSGLLGGLGSGIPLSGLGGQSAGSLAGLNGVLNQLAANGAGVFTVAQSGNLVGVGALLGNGRGDLLNIGELLNSSNGNGVLTGALRTGNGGLLGFALPVVNGVVVQ